MAGSSTKSDADYKALQAEIQKLKAQNGELQHALKIARGELSPESSAAVIDRSNAGKNCTTELAGDDGSENAATKKQLQQALKSIKVFKQQQQQLFDEFVLLRSKYDDLKKKTIVLLWEKLPQGEGVRMLDWAIPPVDRECIQKKTKVGPYELMEHLGDGQFASVHACKKTEQSKNIEGGGGRTGTTGERPQLAVKIITKDKVTHVGTLQRIDNEIRTLWKLNHPGVLRLYEVIHTDKYLYMVTERGGMDLFDFFECYPLTSPETARAIMRGIMAPVLYCHSLNVCHRDLKPENILLEVREDVDVEGNQVTMVGSIKLCDFGLCANCSDDDMLDDFCGSPGFFAPEIVTETKYNGKLTDIWSLGCILLELTIGHDTFNKLWMVAYDYNNLVAPERFKQQILCAVESVRSVMTDVDLLDLITSLLCVVPTQRKNVEEVYGVSAKSAHPWLRQVEEEPEDAGTSATGGALAAVPEPVDSGNVTSTSILEKRPSISMLSPRARACSDDSVLIEGGNGGGIDKATGNKVAAGTITPRLGSAGGDARATTASSRAQRSPREKLSPLIPLVDSPKHRSSPALSSSYGGGGGGGARCVALRPTNADETVMPPNISSGLPPPSPMATSNTASVAKQHFFGKCESMQGPQAISTGADGEAGINGDEGRDQGPRTVPFTPASPASPVKLSSAHTASTGINRNVTLAVDVGPRARHLTSTGTRLPVTNMSNKARADYGKALHMPPLEPETPNVHVARKNFRPLVSPDGAEACSNELWSPTSVPSESPSRSSSMTQNLPLKMPNEAPISSSPPLLSLASPRKK